MQDAGARKRVGGWFQANDVPPRNGRAIQRTPSCPGASNRSPKALTQFTDGAAQGDTRAVESNSGGECPDCDRPIAPSQSLCRKNAADRCISKAARRSKTCPRSPTQKKVRSARSHRRDTVDFQVAPYTSKSPRSARISACGILSVAAARIVVNPQQRFLGLRSNLRICHPERVEGGGIATRGPKNNKKVRRAQKRRGELPALQPNTPRVMVRYRTTPSGVEGDARPHRAKRAGPCQ